MYLADLIISIVVLIIFVVMFWSHAEEIKEWQKEQQKKVRRIK